MTPPATLTAAEMAATPHDLSVANDSGCVTVRATGATYLWVRDLWRLASFPTNFATGHYDVTLTGLPVDVAPGGDPAGLLGRTRGEA